MAKRFKDALYIQDGACNPSGIAHTLIEACREVRAEGGTVTTDPAIRLMVHQLAHICGHYALENCGEWDTCMRQCRTAVRNTFE